MLLSLHMFDKKTFIHLQCLIINILLLELDIGLVTA